MNEFSVYKICSTHAAKSDIKEKPTSRVRCLYSSFVHGSGRPRKSPMYPNMALSDGIRISEAEEWRGCWDGVVTVYMQ